MSDSNPIICGRRNCARCGRWKHSVDFKWRWNKRRKPNPNWYPGSRAPKTVALRSRYPTPVIDSVCMACRRQESHDIYHNLSPEAKKARMTRVNQANQKRRKRWEQEIRMARMVSDTRKSGDNLDITPFRMWLISKVREFGDVTALAQEAKKDPEELRRYMQGYVWDANHCEPNPIRYVTVGLVDEVGINIGEQDLLNRLYPYQDD